MSQKAARAGGAVTDEKEKRKTDSPVKDLKKKMAAVEKEKIPSQEKRASVDKKTADKQESKEKVDKKQENGEKIEKVEKKQEKIEKKDSKEAGGSKAEKSGKPETPTETKQNGTTEPSSPQLNKDVSNSKDTVSNSKDTVSNSKDTVSNGKDSLSNGKDTLSNGKDTVSNGKDMTNGNGNDKLSTEGKVLKMTDTVPPGEKKTKTAENGTNSAEEAVEIADKEIENGESRKPDTNFSKSRVKISPYRRSMRLADQTTSSTAANYTGNNTTMEMDITESSLIDPTLEDSALNEDSFVQTIRSIRGRKSYKQLSDMNLSALSSKSYKEKKLAEKAALNASSDSRSRPTSIVVGRKRTAECVEVGVEAVENKRSRLFATLAHFAPFQRNRQFSDQMIVGINTDLPMSIVPETSTFDPESLKTSPAVNTDTPITPVEDLSPVVTEKETKKCIVM